MVKEKISNLERRKYPRFKDKIFVSGKLNSTPGEVLKAFTENFSAGGLMLETEKAALCHSELELELYQPRDETKRVIFSIPVTGRVVFSKKIATENFGQGENQFRIGIEFLKIEEEDRKIIVDYAQGRKSEE